MNNEKVKKDIIVERCPICDVRLNKVYKFSNLNQQLKNKNNAYKIANGYVCGACNEMEILARMGTPLIVDSNFADWSHVKHKYWQDISVARQKNTIDWLEEIALDMLVLPYEKALSKNKKGGQ